jgi:hypothetical protein
MRSMRGIHGTTSSELRFSLWNSYLCVLCVLCVVVLFPVVEGPIKEQNTFASELQGAAAGFIMTDAMQ